MKDSEEKENRISNLKDMRNKISNTSNDNQNSFDDEEFENSSDDYEIVDAEEMIHKLSEDYDEYDDELTIDDEFIYKPSEDLDNDITPLKDSKIDEDFLIETKLEHSDFPEADEDYNYNNFSFISPNQEEYINDKFDDMITKKIGNYSLLAIICLIIGIILIILGILTSLSSSQRIIDSVSSGEVNTSVVVLIILGILFVIFSLYKLTAIKVPFDNVIDSMKNIDKDENNRRNKKQNDVVIEQKPLANDNKEVKKVGEFDISGIKQKIENVNAEKDGIILENDESEEELNEEEEYKKAQLDNESIDEIFADMKEIEEVPIISIDSKEEEK